MSRNGSGVYSLPAGSTVTNGDTSDAQDINSPLADLEADMNIPRPIVAGGTGASSASAALVNFGLTATAAEINVLDGITATVTELNYADGVTSPIQAQLDAKQAAGATLTSLEGLSLVAGDVLYATAADTLARLPKGTADKVLTMNAGATAPEWADVPTPDVGAETAALSVGAVGTYAMLRFSPTSGSPQAAGSTHAGSGLRYSSSSDNGTGTPSGTWRLMGAIDASSPSASLFLRIS